MSINFASVHYSAAENRKNSLKTFYFGVEGYSRLLIALKSTLPVQRIYLLNCYHMVKTRSLYLTLAPNGTGTRPVQAISL